MGEIQRRLFLAGGLACASALSGGFAKDRHSRLACIVLGGDPAKYSSSTGQPAHDQAVHRAVDAVSHALNHKVTAAVRFMDNTNAHFNSDANVLAFGNKLLTQLEGPDFQTKISCIVAHELAHTLQFSDGYFDLAEADATIRRNELMADTFAGCCLAFLANGPGPINRGTIWSKRPTVESAFRLLFKLGDYHLTNPQHHGTPRDRMNAADAGWEGAYEIAGGDRTGDIAFDVLDMARSGLEQ